MLLEMTKTSFFLDGCEDYTPHERSAFFLHVSISLLSIPLNFVSGYAGLLMFPYLLFLTFKARSYCLLPIIIVLAYSSPLRLVFVLGCFLYTCLHANQLRKYRLLGAWLFYLCLFPFFLWFFYKKITLPQELLGVGDLNAGWGTYFMFSCAFWAVLTMRKMGKTFFAGMLYWSLFLISLVSFVGTENMTASDDAYTGIFCRQVFWAIPFCVAAFCFCLMEDGKSVFRYRIASGAGCLFLFLDWLGILHYDITFTQIGLSGIAVFFMFLAKRMPRLCLRLHPMVFFALSFAVMLYSSKLVEKYAGLYADYGSYDEMKVTDLDSFFKKLQRKAVDDRARVWRFNLQAISDQLGKNPVWIEIKPYAEAVVYEPGQGWQYRQMTMDAHNTLLHLLRHFGIYGGLGLYLVYLYYFCRKENRKILVANARAPCLVVLSTCLAEGIIGGHTGHYPVILSFGPILFALLGSCWRVGYEERISHEIRGIDDVPQPGGDDAGVSGAPLRRGEGT